MQESPKTTETKGPDDPAEPRAVRIVAGSRLHFGLLDTAPPFGGVGVMIDQPVTELLVRESNEFRYDGPDASRIRGIADRMALARGESQPPACSVQLVRRPPPHCGLGSGTQLSLAFAEALTQLWDYPFGQDQMVTSLAGRGKRSAVGSHGYFQGGLVFEEAADQSDLNTVRDRVEIPESWCVVVLRPSRTTDLVSGDEEAEQFSRLDSVSDRRRDELRAMITDAILPAAVGNDFNGFSDAVRQYNHASGELFSAVQGGAYNGRDVTDLVNELVRLGVTGVGQSSWGPGVFAWFESREAWQAFRHQVPKNVDCVVVAHVRNQGRECFFE